LYIEAKFSNYGEVGVVHEVQKERPNEITGTTREEEKAVVADRNRNWGPIAMGLPFFALSSSPWLPLLRLLQEKGRQQSSRPAISSFSSSPPPPLLLYDALTVGLLYTSSQALMAAVAPRTHTCTPVPRCQ
jgi:hypothetical protein